jgi:mRNA-degrading endonuclease RelE of RelBE toxin-antitoxin system
MDHAFAVAPKVAVAAIELIYGDLSKHPYRVGKALRFNLEGFHSARRAEYRIVYKIDNDEITIYRFSTRSTV